ncbi:MAG TPA: hypothetical protein VEQ10_02775, partial [Vicinamibacteria bacterium]|nr:hypothetical protein [Vicinamibacteria bacterium]
MQLPLRSGTPGAASHVRDAGAALVAVTAVTLLLFPGLVFQGRVLFDRDLALMWQPQVESFVHMVTQGSWPLWDPYVSFGRPLLANPNAQVLYPPTWLNLLVRPERFLTLYVLAHLTLAGVGGALLARRLQLGLGASLLTASSFAASGPLLSLVNAWNHLPAACLLPWACLAAEVALARGRARHAAAWGAVLALQVLGGSPDLALFTAAIGGAWLAWYLATAGSAAVRWRLLRSSGIAAVLALCLS